MSTEDRDRGRPPWSPHPTSTVTEWEDAPLGDFTACHRPQGLEPLGTWSMARVGCPASGGSIAAHVGIKSTFSS